MKAQIFPSWPVDPIAKANYANLQLYCKGTSTQDQEIRVPNKVSKMDTHTLDNISKTKLDHQTKPLHTGDPHSWKPSAD